MLFILIVEKALSEKLLIDDKNHFFEPFFALVCFGTFLKDVEPLLKSC